LSVHRLIDHVSPFHEEGVAERRAEPPLISELLYMKIPGCIRAINVLSPAILIE
jgi:hypothetical protein